MYNMKLILVVVLAFFIMGCNFFVFQGVSNMNDSVLIFVKFMAVCDNFFVEVLDIIFIFLGVQAGSLVLFIGYFNE